MKIPRMVRMWRDQAGGKWIQRGHEIALIVAADDANPDRLNWEPFADAKRMYGLRKVWGAW